MRWPCESFKPAGVFVLSSSFRNQECPQECGHRRLERLRHPCTPGGFAASYNKSVTRTSMSERNRASAARRGFSLIELLIVISIILIIITMAVPKFNQAKRFANETGAISAIRNIHEVQVQYQSQYGRFATSLAELGPPQSGAASPAAADLIDNTLAAGEKSGYKIT